VLELFLSSLGILRLSQILPWSLDEFTYAHAAWLISQGQIPYRDFALQHPPLSELMGAPFFLFFGDAVLALLAIRAVLAIFFIWVVYNLRRLAGQSEGGGWGGVILLALAITIFPTWMLELRPDSIAVGLVVWAHLLARRERLVSSGAVLGLALFASEKVLIYGASVPLALLISRKTSREFSRVVLGGALTISALYFTLIYLTGWAPFKLFFIDWTLAHEAAYATGGVLSHHWLELCLVLLLVVRGAMRKAELDLLMFFLLGLLSYLIQKGPWAYSLLPAVAPGIIFMARALPEKLPLRVLTAAVSLCFLIYPFKETNKPQRELLTEIERVVPPDACVYDNTGTAVNRPHLLFYFYTDSLMRRMMHNYHERLVFNALESNPCPAMIKDERFHELPLSMQERLRDRYPECQGRLCLTTGTKPAREPESGPPQRYP
jgi:hypothetical protein